MSTAPAIDEREHSAVVIASIKTALTALRSDIGENVFTHGSVPGEDENAGSLPTAFVALSIERRFVTPSGMVRMPSLSGWRISAHHVASTVNNASLVGLAVANALDGQRLVIDGYTSTPVLLELTNAVAPDSGMFSGLSQWTYAI